MSVVCLIAGGLERNDSLLGIRTVIGDNGLDSPRDTTTNAPLAGLRGVRSHAGQVGGACYIPAQATGTDCPAFAANGRTWLAVHSELIPECLAATNTGATYSLFKLFVGGRERDLQLQMTLGTQFLFPIATADPAVTFTTTTLTDTRYANFVTNGVVVGDWVSATGGLLLVTGVSGNTLTGSGGWHMVSGTKPTDGVAYGLYHTTEANYNWRITDGTTNWDSSARACVIANTTPYVIEFQWKPGLTAATNTMVLWVNGVREINQTGGTVVPAPASVLECRVWIGSDDVAKGNVWPEYVEWYNTIFYDDISQSPFDTCPITYDPLASNRPLVTYRPPKLAGSHKYTAWSPSTGADVSAVIDDHPTISQTDYISSSATGDMESWQCVDLTSCDYPLTTADQVYAVQSIGNCNHGVSGILAMGHTDGASTDDAGRRVRGTEGQGQMLWCGTKDPGGQPWTYASANTVQTWVQDVFHDALNFVFDAGQLILFRKNAAGEVPAVSTATVGTATDAGVV